MLMLKGLLPPIHNSEFKKWDRTMLMLNYNAQGEKIYADAMRPYNVNA